MKKALITGITGQDGSYLAEFLLAKGYEVYGMVRKVALEYPEQHFTRLKDIQNNPNLHFCGATLENYANICRILQDIQPDEVYHLAAQSFVGYSFENVHATIKTNVNGTTDMLSACQQIVPHTKFYFAGSSEMFGKVEEVPQTEKTPFHPRSSYGTSKVFGFEHTRYYRENADTSMFALSGILFNHESPRRGLEFVTRKITYGAAQIYFGLQDQLRLGNPDAKRDWGYAKEYVKAMWLMLQQPEPEDFVIATGETHSVREFAEEVFNKLNLDIEQCVIWNNPQDIRPSEVDLLIGDASKAKTKLGWQPTVKFKQLVEMMVDSDIKSVGSTLK